ncbi:MAG: hypothetical protein AB1384_00390 [Actinomycetota bacterium]
MEHEGPFGESIPVIDDVLDVVKTARYQFGTLAHMGDDLEHSVVGLREQLGGILSFFSRRRNVMYTAAAVIAAAVLLDYARGWTSAFRIRYSFVWPYLPHVQVKHHLR